MSPSGYWKFTTLIIYRVLVYVVSYELEKRPFWFPSSEWRHWLGRLVILLLNHRNLISSSQLSIHQKNVRLAAISMHASLQLSVFLREWTTLVRGRVASRVAASWFFEISHKPMALIFHQKSRTVSVLSQQSPWAQAPRLIIIGGGGHFRNDELRLYLILQSCWALCILHTLSTSVCRGPTRFILVPEHKPLPILRPVSSK